MINLPNHPVAIIAAIVIIGLPTVMLALVSWVMSREARNPEKEKEEVK